MTMVSRVTGQGLGTGTAKIYCRIDYALGPSTTLDPVCARGRLYILRQYSGHSTSCHFYNRPRIYVYESGHISQKPYTARSHLHVRR